MTRPAEGEGRASGSNGWIPPGAKIERGPMAADNFTQIANALFRDPRISFKAKGVFGLISTHRNGWRVTVEDLVRCSTDGRTAVYSALKELEQFDYLMREQERNADGTKGRMVYKITDRPAHLYELLQELQATGEELPSSQPQSGFPHAGRPPAAKPRPGRPQAARPNPADREAKKTKGKNTKDDNTPPSPPSLPAQGTAGGGEGQEVTMPKQQQRAVAKLAGAVLSIEAIQVASAVLVGSPAISSSRAGQIGERIDALLRQGADPDRLTAYLTADMDGARSRAAVIEYRLRPEQVPLERLVEPSASRRPAWCGQCDEQTRLRETEQDGSPVVSRCSACHPSSAAPTSAPF